jgi:F-type H+-transporting ATPase subunit gamma
LASAREIRRRIKSVKNIAQVTRALQAVSASKSRKAQEAVRATRPYAELAWEVLTHLSQQVGADGRLHPLFDMRHVRTIGLVLITGDRGLCGVFNYHLVNTATEFIKEQAVPVKVVAVGKKGRELMWRRGSTIIRDFSGLPPAPRLADVRPIARTVMNGFINNDYDMVYVVYADFVNTLLHKPVVKRLLPVRPSEVESQVVAEYVADAHVGRAEGLDYIYEPSAQVILDAVVPRFVELQIYQAILESLASEHSARLVAMQNATDSAQDLVGNLTLRYNKARQQGITNELLDIAGGAEALAQAGATR